MEGREPKSVQRTLREPTVVRRAEATGVPGAGLRQVSLILGETTLELLEYNNPPSETEAPLLSNNIGASHVAFLVDDIRAKKAELEAKGIEFYSEVNSGRRRRARRLAVGVLRGPPMATRSSSSRSPTTTKKNGALESRRT